MAVDNWNILTNFTHARIAMGRAGNALPTHEILKFRMAHALAKDAVYSALNIYALSQLFEQLSLESIQLHSKADNRNDYLLNPNKGRLLNEAGVETLTNLNNAEYDLCIIVADGLSANAVNLHAAKVMDILIQQLPNWQIAPIIIVEQGRVAISDQIGEILQAKITLILIGERPGLSSPSSMGAYITYNPKIGNTDEKRNCISNIQPNGLSYEFAASKITYMLNQMRLQQLSGVNLKDDFDGGQMSFIPK